MKQLEGKASLYRFQNGNIDRFFYSTDTSSIKQLVYKKYLIKKIINRIETFFAIENSLYKSQLWQNVNCNFDNKTFKNLNYKKEELVEYFAKYNNCKGAKFEKFEEKRRDVLHLNVTPGLNYSSLKMENSTPTIPSTIDFGSKALFRLGVEIEFILPFNKNKWAITIEPYYSYFKSEYSYIVNSFTNRTASIDYSLIEFPIGLRYYIYLNNKSSIFLSTSCIIPNLNFNLKSDLNTGNKELEIKPEPNLVFGIGYNYSAYSIEYKYFMSNNISILACNYNRSSITLGVRILKK